MTIDFSLEMEARRKGSEIFKMVEEKKISTPELDTENTLQI